MGIKDPAITKAPILMPYGYDIRLRFSAAEFHHRTFSATDVTGLLNYSSNVARLDTLSMTSMGGKMNGSVTLVRKENGSYSSNSRLNFRDIDITRAFISFANFRQDFIKSENLRGSLSGRHTMRMDLDSMLMPILGTMSSEGQFSIIDGELINFEPIKKMSNFIEISELENIKFSKLENEFFIAGKTFCDSSNGNKFLCRRPWNIR
ncbi:MAG: AsmA-like C-terminal region-containing protein [Marinilabiliales bacterium]|nr:AsmA-like C-terminal region-containing protein [Marinilabiliales bacterium]